MRRIEAIIRSSKLEEIRALFLKAGINEMTVTEVRDYGNYTTHAEIYRSNVYSVDSLVKTKVETIVPQKMVNEVVSILKATFQAGKGEECNKIFISSVNDICRPHP